MRVVAVPGGEIVLGLAGDVRSTLLRCMPTSTFERFERDGVIDHLQDDPIQAGAYFTPQRKVWIPSMVVEVEATPFVDLDRDDDDDVEAILERACGDEWRLPTPDEWEYLYSAGSRSLFPWGDAWPYTDACPVRPTNFVNAFGLRFSS